MAWYDLQRDIMEDFIEVGHAHRMGAWLNWDAAICAHLHAHAERAKARYASAKHDQIKLEWKRKLARESYHKLKQDGEWLAKKRESARISMNKSRAKWTAERKAAQAAQIKAYKQRARERMLKS